MERRQTPEHLGPYRIIRLIGEGAAGIVYEAEQERPRRRVALKMLRPGQMSSKHLARFAREVEILGRFDHPGIARIYHADTESTPFGPCPYFAMELIEGQPLLETIRSQELSTTQIVSMIIQVGHALDAAHRAGVIHRDLKPENIVVDRNGIPKILDFGVATVSQSDEVPDITLTARWAGTLAYMSPEQAAGLPTDRRSDVYSLGVILFEALCGSPPYPLDGLSWVEKIKTIQDREPPRLRRLRKDLGADLESVLATALEKDVEGRYSSAASFVDDLERCLRGEAVLAQPVSLGARLIRLAARHKASVAGLALSVITLLAGIVGVYALWTKAVDARQRADQHALEAEASRMAAQESYDSITRLSDFVHLDDLVQRAQELWPAQPETVPDLRVWLSEARSLEARRDDHRRVLDELWSRRDDSSPEEAIAETWHREALTSYLAELDSFLDPEDGLVFEIAKRLQRARTLHERSIEAYRQKWQEVARRAAENPMYRGLNLRSQVGLVPLGPDPSSGLEEFAVLDTGPVPERNPEGVLVLPLDFAICLVLVPGGSFIMGAQSQDPSMPNYDPETFGYEAPRDVRLDPYLIGKFEMTQAQWRSLTGENPSYEGKRSFGSECLRHPVESVTWTASVDVLRRIGLQLPTEAQWEHACRARTSTIFHTGDLIESLEGFANILDASGRRENEAIDAAFIDGYKTHAPVGSFGSNAFGLHDMHGNIMEWCLDQAALEIQHARDGDGLLSEPSASEDLRSLRGGSCTRQSSSLRSAGRALAPPLDTSSDRGLRAARCLDEDDGA